ncbi:MAG: hypothetical protein Q9165_003004 [Trypethelium subeluteriae]
MAPIGILTAIVSAIRVCGSPSLRALVGRAQEGGAAAEAELCSSTSRDVCGLFNNGGIARVLGNPKILEAVHVPDEICGETYSDKTRAGLYTFQEYLEAFPMGSWEEIRKEKKVSTDVENLSVEHDKLFALKPNLSLNVGIRNRSLFWTWMAATVGFLLQVFVCIFATLVTFYFRWPKDGARAPSYAYPMTIIGTLAVSCGVFLCAFLIGSSTAERHFERRIPEYQSSPGRLVWVQPGGQIVGDETFDAFAYSDHDRPSVDYTTSWKRSTFAARQPEKVSRDGALLWFAVGMATGGFIVQFVGLRGMHSTVSLMQLGATMIMSGLRALLHTQRLKKEDNFLASCIDLVQGHELDWVALSLAQYIVCSKQHTYQRSPYNHCQSSQENDNPLRQAFQAMLLFFGTTNPGSSLILNPMNPQNFVLDPHRRVVFEGQRQHKGIDDQLNLPRNVCVGAPADPADTTYRALRYRARLAFLTRMQDSRNPLSAPSRCWTDEAVQGRKAARALARTMEATARTLIFGDTKVRPGGKKDLLTWSFECGMGPTGSKIDMNCTKHHPSPKKLSRQTFHLTLQRCCGMDGFDLDEWNMDEDDVEAIVSLWLWSLTWDPALSIDPTEIQSRRSDALSKNSERIIFATQNLAHLRLVTMELVMWVGIQEFHLRDRLGTGLGGSGYFTKDLASPRTVWKLNGGTRFFGWHATDCVSERSERMRQDQFFLVARTRGPLAVLCAQEIFAAFLTAILSIVEDIGGETSCRTERLWLKFSNTQVDSIIDLFVANELGSREEALACIIPVLRHNTKLPSMRCGYAEAKKLARQHQITGRWRASEELFV